MYSDSEKENSMTPDNQMRSGPAENRAEDDCTELHGVQYPDTLPVTDEPETPDADIRISPDEGAGKTGENTDRENTEDQSLSLGHTEKSDEKEKYVHPFKTVIRVFFSVLLCTLIFTSSAALILSESVRIAFKDENIDKLTSARDFTEGGSVISENSYLPAAILESSDIKKIQKYGIGENDIRQLLSSPDTERFINTLLKEQAKRLTDGTFSSDGAAEEIIKFVKDNEDNIYEQTGYRITKRDLSAAKKMICNSIDKLSPQDGTFSLSWVSFILSEYTKAALLLIAAFSLFLLIIINRKNVSRASYSFFFASSLLAASVFSVYVLICIFMLGGYREIAKFILSAESTFWLSIFISSAVVSAIGFLITGKLKKRKRKKAL